MTTNEHCTYGQHTTLKHHDCYVLPKHDCCMLPKHGSIQQVNLSCPALHTMQHMNNHQRPNTKRSQATTHTPDSGRHGRSPSSNLDLEPASRATPRQLMRHRTTRSTCLPVMRPPSHHLDRAQ